MVLSHAWTRLDTGLNPVVHSRDPNFRPAKSDFRVCHGKITTLKVVFTLNIVGFLLAKGMHAQE